MYPEFQHQGVLFLFLFILPLPFLPSLSFLFRRFPFFLSFHSLYFLSCPYKFSYGSGEHYKLFHRILAELSRRKLFWCILRLKTPVNNSGVYEETVPAR